MPSKTRRTTARLESGGFTQHRTEPCRIAPDRTGSHPIAPGRNDSHRAAHIRVRSIIKLYSYVAGAECPISVMYKRLERYFQSDTKYDHFKFTAARQHRSRDLESRRVIAAMFVRWRHACTAEPKLVIY